MENQHRKITGYNELSQVEIDLMNRIKGKGAELLQLHAELVDHLTAAASEKNSKVHHTGKAPSPEALAELERFQAAEPHRWLAISKTDIQTGIMAMLRAVAQPGGGV